MKINSLKTAPRDPLEEAEKQQLEMLLWGENKIKVSLGIYDEKKNTLNLKMNALDLSAALLSLSLDNLINKVVVELTLFDNFYSLHGTIISISDMALGSTDDEIHFAIRIKRNKRDSKNVIKNEMNRQKVNQNQMGYSAYATVRFFPTTYPANPGRLTVKKLALTLGKKSGRVDADDLDLENDLPAGAVQALYEAGYKVSVEGKTRNVDIVHAHFAGVTIKTDVNTKNELLVEITETDLLGNLYNRASSSFANVFENIKYITNRTNKKPALRQISSKNVLIQGDIPVTYQDFDKLAEKLSERYGTVEIEEQQGDNRDICVVRLSGQNRRRSFGEIADFKYDGHARKLAFTINQPVLDQGWVSGEIVGRVEFAIGRFRKNIDSFDNRPFVFFYTVEVKSDIGSLIWLPTDIVVPETDFVSITLNSLGLNFKISTKSPFNNPIKNILDYSDRVCTRYSITPDRVRDNYIKDILVKDAKAELKPNYTKNGYLYKIYYRDNSDITFPTKKG